MDCRNRAPAPATAAVVFACGLLVSGCSPQETSDRPQETSDHPQGTSHEALTDAERAAVISAVDSAVRAFRQADLDLDGQGVVDHLWPEFYMYGDGVRSEYPTVRDNILAFMAGLKSFDTEWSDVEVVPLGRDAALASFLFRDSIVTVEGALVRSQGPTTLIWQRRGAEWRLLYADADHYQVAKAEAEADSAGGQP